VNEQDRWRGLHTWQVSRVPLWRARALLRPWWDAGACPAALLHAIDHHPDNPDHHRGDALRGTRDPLRVLGARLRPWRGRLSELPARLAGIRGDYRPPRPPDSPTPPPQRSRRRSRRSQPEHKTPQPGSLPAQRSTSTSTNECVRARSQLCTRVFVHVRYLALPGRRRASASAVAACQQRGGDRAGHDHQPQQSAGDVRVRAGPPHPRGPLGPRAGPIVCGICGSEFTVDERQDDDNDGDGGGEET